MHVLLSLQTLGTAVVLVLAVITKYYRPGSLNKTFLMVLSTGKFKIKVSTDVVSNECLLPSLQTAAFVLSFHMAEGDHLFLKQH